MPNNYDFAICYFGLTRSTKKVYKSHIEKIYNILKKNNLSYKIFMHTWKINGGGQRIWNKLINKEIDYSEYKLLNPDFYKLDNQNDFLKKINFDDYFYKDVWKKYGHSRTGEWLPQLITNHLCALESQKRCLEMVENYMINNNNFKYIMFIRPDMLVKNNIPINSIINSYNKISIPDTNHNEGYNDRFAIMNYKNACIYGKRINEIKEFRKNNGRIVSEKYVKFIADKYKFKINKIKFYLEIIRP